MDVILINDTTASISIGDLYGMVIDSTEEMDILDKYPYGRVSQSDNLKGYVSDGDIIINDGIKNLTPEEGVEHLTLETMYEAKHILSKHTDISNPPDSPQSVIKSIDSTSYQWIKFPTNLEDLEDIPDHPNDGIKILSFDGTAYIWASYSYEEFWIGDNSESSTSSTSWKQKLRLNFTTSFQGDYKVSYSALVSHEIDGVRLKTRIQLDDTNTYHYINKKYHEKYRNDIWDIRAGSFIIDSLLPGQHTLDLDYSTGKCGKSTYIKEVIITARRLC